MKSNYKIALTLLVGATLGAATIHGINAQAKPLAYVVIDVAEMNDTPLFRAPIPKAPDALADIKGRYLIRTEK